MMRQGVGLVLAGGYGNGAYQIGVWRALREFGIDQKIIAVTGASVGAFNAVLFFQNDYYAAEKLWVDMDGDKTFTVGVRNLMNLVDAGGLSFKKNYGQELFSRQGIESLIDENVSLGWLGKSAMDFFVAAYNQGKKRVEYFKTNDESLPRVKKILLAAMAHPFGYGAEEIDGEIYLDAGVAGQVPIKPLYDMGIRHFVVISGGNDDPVRAEEFPDANIIEIAAGRDGKLGSGKQDKRQRAMAQLAQGYAEAMQILKPIYELGAVQARIAATLQGFYSAEAQYIAGDESATAEREMLKRQIDGAIK